MDEDFNPDELRPIPYRPDTELMLGPWTLGTLFFLLILLCGICFSVGYSVGKRGAHNSPVTGQPEGAQATSPVAGSGAKPSAVPQTSNRARPAIESQPASDATAAVPAPDSSATGSASLDEVNSPQPVVKPALPNPANPAAPGLALMVQVAAVSHQEDADVLIGALRKRGYAVNVHHDPVDGMIHVRIGPFANRDDANATRQKLLNDGYNATVQP